MLIALASLAVCRGNVGLGSVAGMPAAQLSVGQPAMWSRADVVEQRDSISS
jgi:hypothetical protein